MNQFVDWLSAHSFLKLDDHVSIKHAMRTSLELTSQRCAGLLSHKPMLLDV